MAALAKALTFVVFCLLIGGSLARSYHQNGEDFTLLSQSFVNCIQWTKINQILYIQLEPFQAIFSLFLLQAHTLVTQVQIQTPNSGLLC